MEQICDLHTHSVFSDGTYTPTEIINEALEKGLSAVALCDHNTINGLGEFLEAAKGKNIEAICGSELSVDYNGIELHLLGLFIPPSKFKAVLEKLEESNEQKRLSNIALIDALNQAGYEIDYETVEKSCPNGRFNRSHVAEELTRKGYTSSIQEAFDTLLDREHGYYIDPKRPSVFEMIVFINEIGAVPVLAHPFLNLSYEELDAFLPLAKEKGLMGMECFYSTYDEETTKKSIELADKYGLAYSGGSDFHGGKKPDINLGSGYSDLQIPYDWAGKLKS